MGSVPAFWAHCDRCDRDTRHFATLSLGLPCCVECFALNEHLIFEEGVGFLTPLKNQDIILRNALIESEVMRRKREDEGGSH